MNLYVFQTHNYFNRQIKRAETIAEYTEKFGAPFVFNNINFIINDGIRTTQVVNYSLEDDFLATGQEMPSYLIVTDDDANIVHRWWIVESKITRWGQAQLSLLRDVIADFYYEVLRAPSFVKKGWLNTPNDPGIFNNENMTFNQIKTSETLLPDRSNTPWYIGYLNKEDLDGKSFELPKQPLNVAQSYDSFNDYPYYKYNVNNPYKMDYTEFVCSVFTYVNYGANYQIGWDENGNLKDPVTRNGWYKSPLVNMEGVLTRDDVSNNVGYRYTGSNIIATVPKVQQYAVARGGWSERARSYLGVHTATDSQLLQNENGKIYMIAGIPYRVRLTSTTVQELVEVPNNLAYAIEVKSMLSEIGDFNTSSQIKGTCTNIWYSALATVVNLDVVPEDEYSLSFELPTNRIHTEDLPYDIIAIPAKALAGDVGQFQNNEELAKIVVNGIIAQLPKGDGGTFLYDFQLLPYCPLPDSYFWADSTLKLSNLQNTANSTNYTLIETSEGQQTVIVYIRNADVSKTIILSNKQIGVPTTAKEFKIANEVDMYRLVSPNYNGQFEFSATGNGGILGWNIAMTCKPYNPYIKVSPMFGRLYGKDFGDARGLICGGDFSISQTNDAWEQYQLQNKNYQTMFDRQIENMKVNNSIQREREKWNIGFGALSGVAGGAGFANLASGGNPLATVGGALAGGVSSVAGGLVDLKLNDALRAEALDYAKDNFGYQLQNIQALPYSLTKVGAQNVNYKDFPFVEYYTCSNTERNALEDKINYNGMTIMRIGQVANFLKDSPDTIGTFIQAQPIRLDNLKVDGHIAEVISSELQTGVYIY